MNLKELLILFLLSILPLWEGRYTVILALTQYVGVDMVVAFTTIIAATLFLALALTMFMQYIDKFFMWCGTSRNRLLKFMYVLYSKYLNRARVKAKPYVERYGVLALTIFVVVPVPATGVWTGALIAYIFGFDKVKAFIALFSGGVASITIVSLLYLFFRIVIG